MVDLFILAKTTIVILKGSRSQSEVQQLLLQPMWLGWIG